MTYLLDSDTCIHLLKRNQRVRDRAAALPVGAGRISEITLAELWYGAKASQQPTTNLQLVGELLNSMGLLLLPISPYISRFADEKARLRSTGQLIPDFDLLIGCTALAGDFVLVTGNTRHFARLPGIRLADWTTPPVG